MSDSMNNIPYPYMPFPNMPPQMPNYEEEIRKLKYEIESIKKRLNNLEKKDTKNYLEKEEGMYMM